MNIKVNLQDGTPAQFKTEIIDGAIVVTVVEEENQESNLFPKWEELCEISGYWINYNSDFEFVSAKSTESYINSDIFTTEDLAKAALATARVSQTYRRYRELVGEVELPELVRFGLILMAFRNEEDWFAFRESNKDDLDLIFKVSNTVQL